MFTGIIETLGEIITIERDQNNMHITICSSISNELKVDQSVSHNGICLTVVDLKENQHTVTAIQETLLKTNLQYLKKGDLVNLERCTRINGRLDGHIVQGHVDDTAICYNIEEEKGSWRYFFKGGEEIKKLVVNKGSICINGISLTIVDVEGNNFSVAIIPYTYNNTNFCEIKKGDVINIEYDIVGKYILKNIKDISI